MDKKGEIRQSRKFACRLESENVRRVLLASAVSVLVLTPIWLAYSLNKEVVLSEEYGWVMLAVIGLVGVGFFLCAYVLVRKKRTQQYIYCIRGFWLTECVLMAAGSLLGSGKLCAMMHLLLLIAGISLIPIFPPVEQFVCFGMECGLVAVHVYLGNVDMERALYCLVIIAFGNVVAHQSYRTFLRQLMDSTKLTSVKRQAETDLMTKLLNRRGLENRISTVWPVCNRQGMDVAVIMLDIDNFKKYNDSFGHGAGDTCIQRVAAALLKHAKRTSDYAARVGGEEFLIFLTGIKPADAVKWAMECKQSIEDMKIPHAKGNFLPYVSVSMGICCCNLRREHMEFWELRNEADRSLYQAKEAGRACIFMKDQMYAKTMQKSGFSIYGNERAYRSV